MAMSSTKAPDMNRTVRLIASTAVATVLFGTLGACTQSQMHVTPNFGVALNSALAAQIADPEAQYPSGPAPADGSRAGLAQARYRTGTVTPPRVVDTTTVRSSSSPR
jgi:type IV pilus biogenesis protein CpaD/CtpE